MAGNFLSNTNTTFIMVCTICSSRCVYMPSFLDWPTPLFCIPSSSVFQHLCWVQARASDKALCVPSLGDLPCFSSWLLAPPSWKPHNCLPFSSTIPLQPDRSPKGQQTHPGPDRNTLKPLDPHLSRKGETLSLCKVLGRRWRQSQGEQPLHNAISHFAASGHEIKRGIHCRSLKSFL